MRSSTAEYAQWNAIVSVNETVGVCVCSFFWRQVYCTEKKTGRAIPYSPISQKAMNAVDGTGQVTNLGWRVWWFCRTRSCCQTTQVSKRL